MVVVVEEEEGEWEEEDDEDEDEEELSTKGGEAGVALSDRAVDAGVEDASFRLRVGPGIS